MKDNKFLFSASTCAFQIEGARNLGGRTDSIWDEFTKRNFTIPPVGVAKREINSIEVAADFYHKYKTDVRIMKKLGLNAFVYNMDWTRIFPWDSTTINPEGIKFYIDLFEQLTNAGIKPIPILYHWDTPMWAQLQGGFENRDIVEWFRTYAKTCFKYLGKYTDTWFVNDENSTFTQSAYLSDYLPPARNDKTAFVKALHNLNLTAAVAKEEFELAKVAQYLNKDAILGIDHDWNPAIDYEGDQNSVAVKQYNEWWMKLFLDPNLKGQYPQCFYDYIAEHKIKFEIPVQDLEYLKKHKLDFIGWNYYRPIYVSKNEHQDNKQKFIAPPSESHLKELTFVYPKDCDYTKWNWLIDESRLVSGAIELSQRYGKDIPIMIIENGMGDFDDKSQSMIKDYDRIDYLKRHIREVLKAREFVNMIGYSLWTYCDIYSPSGGYRKDYGLVSVNFNSPLRTRKPKLSYVWYQNVIKNEGKELEFDKKYLENEYQKILDEWDIFYQ
ncbi:glycoside hydrolase family 1 protein [Spiroplasma culicicola]|uniref:Aryl-phospho-beta-d-glucosidase n=1 Tax=Spiroplasma culicicola AES-1 TaxID=1276246 RepID=W6AFU6_9MOLU|nr:glycoside hydrolase family 1 protein [Spiroplasma culicicola]AHI52584.1 aryl-phospho-beta-d-glucosidase [Spiroplasma culicicola AES-1]